MTSNQDGQVVKRTTVKKTISGRKSRVRLPEWVTINVGGTKFMTRREHFKAFPDALLGKELYAESPHYNRITGEFMFDRNPVLFQYILDYYRTGDLHFPHNFCGPTIKKELYYWGIDENDIAPCCWSRYKEYDEQQATLERLGKGFNVLDTFDKKHNGGVGIFRHLQVWRRRIYYFLENPKVNIGAKLFASFYMLLIMASVLTLALETHQNFRIRDEEREMAIFNQTGSINSTVSPTASATPDSKLTNWEKTKPHPVLTYIDIVVNSIFALVLILRFITCPSKVRFLQNWTNLLDFIVVVSQWVVSGILFVPRYYENDTLLRVYSSFSVLRVARVFLIFKLARHYTGLRILLLALRASIPELFLLVIFMVIGMFIFSTLIFYAELTAGDRDHYGNIPVGFWWSIVTMTTVGYGDVHPTTHWGYFVGALCAVSGMLATGLPIPIIANNFTLYYTVANLKHRMESRHEKPGLLSIKGMKDRMKKLATDITDAAKDVFKNKSSDSSDDDIEEEDEEALKREEESPKGERCGDGTPATTANDGKVIEAKRKIEASEKRSLSPMPSLLEVPEKGAETDAKQRSRSRHESGDSDKKSKNGDDSKERKSSVKNSNNTKEDKGKDKKGKKDPSPSKSNGKEDDGKEKKKGDKDKESPPKSEQKDGKQKKEEDAKSKKEHKKDEKDSKSKEKESKKDEKDAKSKEKEAKKDEKDAKSKEKKSFGSQKQEKGKPIDNAHTADGKDKKDKKGETPGKNAEKEQEKGQKPLCVKYKAHGNSQVKPTGPINK